MEEEKIEEELTEEEKEQKEELENKVYIDDDEKEELERLRKKDFNWKELREKNKVKEEELAKEKENLLKEKEDWQQQKLNSWKEEAIMFQVGDDEETKKKALYNYDRIKGEPKTKEEVAEQMRDAVAMAKGYKTPDSLSKAVNYEGSSKITRKSDDKDLSDDAKAAAEQFGITKADIKNWKPNL
jgi:hypothetical protein